MQRSRALETKLIGNHTTVLLLFLGHWQGVVPTRLHPGCPGLLQPAAYTGTVWPHMPLPAE